MLDQVRSGSGVLGKQEKTGGSYVRLLRFALHQAAVPVQENRSSTETKSCFEFEKASLRLGGGGSVARATVIVGLFSQDDGVLLLR